MEGERRLRTAGGVAYGAAVLIFMSTVFGVFAGPLNGAEDPVVDPVILLTGAMWMVILLIPFWALRWVTVDRLVRRVAGLFVATLVLGQLPLVWTALADASPPLSVVVFLWVVWVAHIIVGLALGLLLRRRPDGLQGLHVELSWALIAYIAMDAAHRALPTLLVPLSGVALTVVYIGLGIAYRRAASASTTT